MMNTSIMNEYVGSVGQRHCRNYSGVRSLQRCRGGCLFTSMNWRTFCGVSFCGFKISAVSQMKAQNYVYMSMSVGNQEVEYDKISSIKKPFCLTAFLHKL